MQLTTGKKQSLWAWKNDSLRLPPLLRDGFVTKAREISVPAGSPGAPQGKRSRDHQAMVKRIRTACASNSSRPQLDIAGLANLSMDLLLGLELIRCRFWIFFFPWQRQYVIAIKANEKWPGCQSMPCSLLSAEDQFRTWEQRPPTRSLHPSPETLLSLGKCRLYVKKSKCHSSF